MLCYVMHDKICSVYQVSICFALLGVECFIRLGLLARIALHAGFALLGKRIGLLGEE